MCAQQDQRQQDEQQQRQQQQEGQGQQHQQHQQHAYVLIRTANSHADAVRRGNEAQLTVLEVPLAVAEAALPVPSGLLPHKPLAARASILMLGNTQPELLVMPAATTAPHADNWTAHLPSTPGLQQCAVHLLHAMTPPDVLRLPVVSLPTMVQPGVACSREQRQQQQQQK